MDPNKVYILETTLRDGGYEIDHQFTADDTAILTGALDHAGFTYLELCHGNGVGIAGWPPRYQAGVQPAASDDEHLAAAQSMSPRAQYGVILVAGEEFTPASYLDRLPARGVKFVRLAVGPAVFADQGCWLPYVERIKSLGMIASINLMQTAAIPIKVVAEGAAAAARRGADWFYVVDSFGGMQPNDVQAYIRAIIDASGLVAGLHAHNNGGLAVANSLAAVAAGARLVDSTLQGIGRATGNPPTEILLLALQQLGHETSIDLSAVLALGDLARPLFAEKGNDPTSFVSGSAQIHSRALPSLTKAAIAGGRSVREFVLRVGREAARRALPVRDSFPEELVRSVLEATPRATPPTPSRAIVHRLRDACVRDSGDDLKVQAESLFVRATKLRKTAALHLVDAAQFPFPAALPWESKEVVGLSVPVRRDTMAALTDRLPELVVVDPAIASWPGLPRGRSHTLQLSFAAVQAEATANLVAALGAEVWAPRVAGLDQVLAALKARGITVHEREPAGGNRVIVTRGDLALTQLRAGDRVVTLQVGPERTTFVDKARAAGAVVLVPPIGAQLVGWVIGQLATAPGATATSWSAISVDKIGAVAPWVAPGTGEIVVDVPNSPTRVVDAAAAGGAPPFEALATLRATAILKGTSGL